MWMIFICFTIVDFPDSPAPVRRDQMIRRVMIIISRYRALFIIKNAKQVIKILASYDANVVYMLQEKEKHCDLTFFSFKKENLSI